MNKKQDILDKKTTEIIGQKLKSLREYKGFSLQYVADKILASKNRGTIQHWEAGRSQPNLTQLKKITELYGVDVLEFLGDVYTEVFR